MLTVGALDPTFGTAGLMTLPGYGAATSVHAAPSGQVLVTTAKGLVRLNANGTVDTTFGNMGVANPGFSPVDVVVESSGKLLVVGTSAHRFAVAQYNTNGTLDISFGTGGLATARDMPSLRMQATGVVIQSDGKIVIGGSETDLYVSASPDNDYSTAVLIRLNANGTLDTAYGSNGIADIGDGYTAPVSIALTTGGEVAATAPLVQLPGDVPRTELVRVSTSGQTVTRLNLEAITPASDGSGADNATYKSLFTDGTGRPVIYRADGSGDATIEAYNSSGLDGSFGNAGDAEVASNFIGMTPASDGSFYVANSDSSLGSLVVRHYTSAGQIDHSFGGVGAVAPALTAASSHFTFTGPMTTLANGDLVATGVNNRGQLVLAEVQLTSATATNPTAANTVSFAAHNDSRWAYVTVTFNQGANKLVTSSTAPNGLTVLKWTNATGGALQETTANLVSQRGGNGTPITATYAFAIGSNGAISAADAGNYQFAVAGSAAMDTGARGSVGTYAGCYSLYFSHSTASRSRPVTVASVLDPDPV